MRIWLHCAANRSRCPHSAAVFRDCHPSARLAPLRRPREEAAGDRHVRREIHDETLVEAVVHRAVGAWGCEPTRLLQVLRETQESLGYLPELALERMSAALGVSIARVRGVVAFYSFLYAEPQGEYRVLFSDNVTDRMRGSEARLRELSQRLWVESGKVSEDGLVSLGRTSCAGLDDHAPALLLNGRPVPDVDAARATLIGDLILARVPLAEWPPELFVVEDRVRRADVMLTDPDPPGRGDPRGAGAWRGGRHGAAGHPRGDQGGATARSRRRGLHDRREVGELQPPARHAARRGLQRRRG